MTDKEKLDKIRELISKQYDLSVEITAILEEPKIDFWQLLDMEIDRCINEIKWDIRDFTDGRFKRFDIDRLEEKLMKSIPDEKGDFYYNRKGRYWIPIYNDIIVHNPYRKRLI